MGAILAAQAAPPPAAAPRPPVPPCAAAGPWATHPPWQNQAHAKGGPVLAPKPPPSNREVLVRKTATQRLGRQCSSEARGGGVGVGAGSNAQHVVYEAVCGKAGLSLYSKLFQSYGSKNR